MLTYADVCWRMRAHRYGPDAYAEALLTYAHVCSRMLTYAHVCSRMRMLLIQAYQSLVFNRMLTYADEC
jgi:hypothetical protein